MSKTEILHVQCLCKNVDVKVEILDFREKQLTNAILDFRSEIFAEHKYFPKIFWRSLWKLCGEY